MPTKTGFCSLSDNKRISRSINIKNVWIPLRLGSNWNLAEIVTIFGMFILSLSDTTLKLNCFLCLFQNSQTIQPTARAPSGQQRPTGSSEPRITARDVLTNSTCGTMWPTQSPKQFRAERSRVCAPRCTGTNTCHTSERTSAEKEQEWVYGAFHFRRRRVKSILLHLLFLQDHAGFTGYMQQNYGTTDTVLNTVSLGKWKTWGCTSAAVQRAWLHRNNTNCVSGDTII